MNIRIAKTARYAITLPVVVLFACLHQLYVTRAHPDAVFMDSLRLVYQMDQWRHGHLPFLRFWGLGAEHQGFINQSLLFLNVKYFSFDVMLANRLTGVVVALASAIVLLIFNRTTSEKISIPLLTARVGISLLIAILFFSWAGFELFTLDLGLPLWIKNLSFVAYFAGHACYLAMPPKAERNWLVCLGLCLAGPVIVLFIGMGWSYSFVAAVAAVSLLAAIDYIRTPAGGILLRRFLPTITLIIAQAAYLMASIGVGGTTAPHDKFTSLAHVPELLPYALGSGLIGVETITSYPRLLSALPYFSIGAIIAGTLVLFARFRRGLFASSLLPIYLMAYGFLTALSVSVARGGEGASAVMASRYYMDIMLFYVGLLWLWLDAFVLSPGRSPGVSMAALLLLCAVVAIGQGLTYEKEWRSAPYRAMAFKAMNQALLQGVPDQHAASLLQSPLDNARKGDHVLLEQHLALYSELSTGACQAKAIKYLDGWYAPESRGIWMGHTAELQIPACRCEFVFRIYLPPDFPGRSMVVSGAAGDETVELAPGKEEQVHIRPSGSTRKLFISVTKTTTPARQSGGRDLRSLGAFLTSGSFVCNVGASE